MTRLRSLATVARLALAISAAATAQGQAARHWHAGTWSMLSRIRGGPQGLGRIEALAFDGRYLYTYSYDSHTLESFDLEGRSRWRIDGSAPGTQPVGNASDLELDARGQLWVVDSKYQRVNVYSSDGTLLRSIQGPRSVQRVAPVTNGGYWLFTPVDTTPSLYSESGRRLVHLILSKAIEGADFVARDPSLTPVAGGGMLITYRWSDRFVVVGPVASRWREFRAVDQREFPHDDRHARSFNGMQIVQLSIDPAAPVAALSSDVDDGVLYDLFGVGAHGPDQTFGTIDTYDINTGRYSGSYRLPSEAEAIRVRGVLFAAIVPGPPSSIVVWKWAPAH